jgi:hypothetical protein
LENKLTHLTAKLESKEKDIIKLLEDRLKKVTAKLENKQKPNNDAFEKK